jgi:uncharacterized membrane protein
LRTAVGCGTAIISFVVMGLLFSIVMQIAYHGDKAGYYSSSFLDTIVWAPILLIVSIVVGVFAAARTKDPKKTPTENADRL